MIFKYPIKRILIFENVLCIYRNYVSFGRISRFLIIVRSMMELVMAGFTVYCQYVIPRQNEPPVYIYPPMVYSLYVIFTSIKNSKVFMEMAELTKSFHLQYKNEPQDYEYFEKMTKIRRVSLIVSSCYIILKFSLAIYFYVCMFDTGYTGFTNVILYVVEFFLYFTYERYICEFPIIYCFLFIISDQAECVTRSVERKIREIKSSDVLMLEDRIPFGELHDRWSASYKAIMKTLEVWHRVFGVQIAMKLGLFIIYYIQLLYQATTHGVSGSFTPMMKVMYLFAVLEHILTLFILSNFAQSAENSGNALRSRLATLLVHSLECDKQHKAVRDLLRLVCTHPIRTAAFGSISVNMTLLPTCIAVCTSYTVIALQFNNIV